MQIRPNLNNNNHNTRQSSLVWQCDSVWEIGDLNFLFFNPSQIVCFVLLWSRDSLMFARPSNWGADESFSLEKNSIRKFCQKRKYQKSHKVQQTFLICFSFLKTEIFRTPKASLTGKLNVLSQYGFVFLISVLVLKNWFSHSSWQKGLADPNENV